MRMGWMLVGGGMVRYLIRSCKPGIYSGETSPHTLLSFAGVDTLVATILGDTLKTRASIQIPMSKVWPTVFESKKFTLEAIVQVARSLGTKSQKPVNDNLQHQVCTVNTHKGF